MGVAVNVYKSGQSLARAWNAAVVRPVKGFANTHTASLAYKAWYHAVGQNRLEGVQHDDGASSVLAGVTGHFGASIAIAGLATDLTIAYAPALNSVQNTSLAAAGLVTGAAVHIVPMQLHSLYVAGKHKAQQQAQPPSPQ